MPDNLLENENEEKGTWLRQLALEESVKLLVGLGTDQVIGPNNLIAFAFPIYLWLLTGEVPESGD